MQAWCNLQVELCDPCLSASYALNNALYKYFVNIPSIMLSYVTPCLVYAVLSLQPVNDQ